MAKLLLNLRHVPEDEIAEIRDWLEENQIEFYETQPSIWGISAGGIWIRDNDEHPRAKALMKSYQQERYQRAVAERERAQREGELERFSDEFRNNPGKTVAMLAAAGGVLLISLLPMLYFLGILG